MGRESRERGNSLEGCCEHCSKSCAENYAPCLSVSNSPDAPLVKGTMTRATKMIGRLIMLAVSVQERAKGESKQRGSWRTVIILVLLRVHIPSPPRPSTISLSFHPARHGEEVGSLASLKRSRFSKVITSVEILF